MAVFFVKRLKVKTKIEKRGKIVNKKPVKLLLTAIKNWFGNQMLSKFQTFNNHF
jgi:hypothetical protein